MTAKNIGRPRNFITKGWVLDRIRIETNGCWVWYMAQDRDGYGLLRHRNRNRRVHRATYMLFKGKIPRGMLVRHTCDNPSCCNPEHLICGTHKDNMKDMRDRGRAASNKGENNPGSVLNDDAIRHIRRSNLLQRELASIYSVSISLISLVRRGSIWTHVQD